MMAEGVVIDGELLLLQPKILLVLLKSFMKYKTSQMM
jgi:hypothetical protein